MLRSFALAFATAVACAPYSPPPLPDPEVQPLGKLPGTDCALFRIRHLNAAGGFGESTYVTACGTLPSPPEPLTCREIENLR